jgi:hypothetical protein
VERDTAPGTPALSRHFAQIFPAESKKGKNSCGLCKEVLAHALTCITGSIFILNKNSHKF